MIIPEEPEYMLLWLSNCEWNQLDGREAGLDLIIGDFGGMLESLSQVPAAENGCPGGGDSCGIYARPCGPLDSGGLFVVGSLEKHVRNGKEPTLAPQNPALGCGGGCICVGSINVT